MNDLEFLFHDPRPELPDNRLWAKLLKLIPTLEDGGIALLLQRRLWIMRSAGVLLRRDVKARFRFVPIIGPGGDYDTEEFFNEQKREFLLPYMQEIRELFRRVDEQ